MRKFEEVKRALPEPELTEVSTGKHIENVYLRSEGPCLVFVHGGGGSLWNNFIQMDEFKEDYGILSYNLSGYGNSSYESGKFLEDHKEDLRQLIDAHGLGDKEIIVHGHSYGTEIALEFAKDHEVEGLVLTGGGGYNLTPSWEKPLLRLFLATRLYKIDMPGILKKKVLGLCLHSETSDHKKRQFLKSNPVPRKRSAWKTIIDSFWNYDSGDISKIEVPVLILHGVQDPVVPLKAARKTQEELTRAKIEEIEEAGHIPFVENPKKYNKYLRQFLEQETE